MLTEKQLELFGDRMAGLYQAFEQDVIADIARRVKATGRYTETAELMAQSMHNAGVSPQKIRAEVMKTLRADKAYQDMVSNNTIEYKKYVKGEIRAMEKEAAKEGNMIIAEAGDMSFNYDLSMWEQAGKTLTKDSSIVKMMEEVSAITAGTFKNITKTSGFKGAHDFASIQNAYTKSLDKAVIKMATGTFAFDRCVNDCVKELAQSGLRSVDYENGRTYQLDTAARMCIRTSCHQLSAKISMRNCDVTGTDLVEVSSHWGAREDHAAWQGKIYSRSGKNKKYPDFSVCRYGAVDGLCGVNCRHTFYPFFEGISEPTQWEPEPAPKSYFGKSYTYTEATQKQRQMERDVRATKREIEAQRAIGGDTSVLEAKKRRQINEYHSFSKSMEIRAKDNRLRVVAGSSDLKKTKRYTEYENRVKNTDERGIISVNRVSLTAEPNSVTQITKKNGGIDRNYYDSSGKQVKQISNYNHGNPTRHPFGKNGEHAHDYIWKDGEVVERPVRELTEKERKENSDIL